MLILLIISALVFVSATRVAWGQAHDNCNGQSCNDGGLGTSVQGSRSYGLAGADVDLAQCYRSWSVILYQGSKPNYFCVADALDAKGLHEAAAITRCSVKSFNKLFDDCIAMNTVVPRETLPMAETPDDDDERVDELYAMVAELEAGYQNQAIPQKTVIIDDGAERRARARAARDEVLEGKQ